MKYGIMQGRLLPKFKGLYQSHPIGIWQLEFEKAASLSLDCIEFIFDSNLYSFNPIYNDPNQIMNTISKTGVKVRSICADFFMDQPIQYANANEIKLYGTILEKLIKNLSFIGGSNIVIPFVDNSSIKKEKHIQKIVAFLNEFKSICAHESVTLAIESDLPPIDIAKFIEMFDNNHISINYDSGNSASLGFSFEEEIKHYGSMISNIHIKDRLLGGGPVKLGEGNTDLLRLKNFITSFDYKGLIIFQSYRDEEGAKIFKDQFDYFNKL